MKRIFLLLVVACMVFTASAQLIKEGSKAPWKKPVAEQYLKGAVPVENGKVIFNRNVDLSTDKTGNLDKTFEEAKHWIANQFGSNPDMLSRKSIEISPEKHSFSVQVEQWLVFTNKALSLDRSRIYYTLSIQLVDGKAMLSISDISYLYEEEREAIRLTAEEQIVDEVCLKKDGKSMYPAYGKFRVRTIQMVDNIEASLQETLK